MKARAALILTILAGVFLLPGSATAGGSAPALSITSVTPIATLDGVRALTVAGSFNFDDLLQFSFPAGVIVSQGSHFVRYDLSGEIVEGDDAAVADGIDVTEIPALLSAGAAAAAPAAMTQLHTDRISITLPSDFTAGAASVMLYAVLETDPFASNPVAVTLP